MFEKKIIQRTTMPYILGCQPIFLVYQPFESLTLDFYDNLKKKYKMILFENVPSQFF